MTALVSTEIDGERLTDEEIGAFLVLLAVAGNDTTRHTSSHALRALTEHPDQRSLLMEDLDEHMPTAVEEFVRWASPVMTFRRTATRDAEVGGQPVRAGEKVVLFYGSANRDDTAFDEPGRFDVTREPNYHVGFGGGGPHYCLGASLARTQLRALFSELLTRLPDIQAGEPERARGQLHQRHPPDGAAACEAQARARYADAEGMGDVLLDPRVCLGWPRPAGGTAPARDSGQGEVA